MDFMGSKRAGAPLVALLLCASLRGLSAGGRRVPIGCTPGSGSWQDKWVGSWQLVEGGASCAALVAEVSREDGYGVGGAAKYTMWVTKGNSTLPPSCAPYNCKGGVPAGTFVAYWYLYEWGDCDGQGRTYLNAATQARLLPGKSPDDAVLRVQGETPWWHKRWSPYNRAHAYPVEFGLVTDDTRKPHCGDTPPPSPPE